MPKANHNREIFRRGSRTYFWASRFFPKNIREEVETLYAFVRVADDFVDQLPPKPDKLAKMAADTLLAWQGERVADPIVTNFVDLAKKIGINLDWIKAFLSAMKADLKITKYQTFAEVERYMYGSAEVIGLMMARIMRLPKKADGAAMALGKAMQWTNFLRDIKEDLGLGRIYIPQRDLRSFGLVGLPPKTQTEINRFRGLVAYEIQRLQPLWDQAKVGYKYIPNNIKWPVITASLAYEWTAQEIDKNPMRVFSEKIKPTLWRIGWFYLKARGIKYL